MEFIAGQNKIFIFNLIKVLDCYDRTIELTCVINVFLPKDILLCCNIKCYSRVIVIFIINTVCTSFIIYSLQGSVT